MRLRCSALGVTIVLSATAALTGVLFFGESPAMAATGSTDANDWPMWRYDAQRRAFTAQALSESLALQWTLSLPAPSRAWLPQGDHMDKLDFDVSYSPVVLGHTLYVASMVNDSLTAYDTRNGRERWRFYADGPMRLAPAAGLGRVYAVSDDGFLYCLDAESGAELWRFRGGPDDRRLLGNTRLINMWAARGGPVLHDGVVYFAASVWPLMGIFIHALDAETGQAIWSNTGSGAHYNLHQHGGAYSFGGVAPQGYFTVAGDLLLASGGRTVPAAYDRHTGAFKYFEQASGTVGKGAGGYRVGVQGNWYYNHGMMYSLVDGAQFDRLDADVLSDDAVYVVSADDGNGGCRLEAYAPEPEADMSVELENRLDRGELRKRYSHNLLWTESVDAPVERLHLRAGDRLYGSGANGLVVAISLPRGDMPAQVVWQEKVAGDVWEMLAADERLFVVTRDGAIHCFGAAAASSPSTVAGYVPADSVGPSEETMERALHILEQSGISGGYAVMFGAGDDYLAEALVRQSDLHVVVVDPAVDVVAAMRRRYSDLDLYGRSLAFHAGDVRSFDLPPYFAELVLVEDMAVAGALDEAAALRLFHPLRPYGGTALLPFDEATHGVLAALTLRSDMPVDVAREGDYSVLKRPGPLPGAGQWTHQYADSSNTSFSPDNRVKAPLGILWYGGPCNKHILPRHGQGPIPHVVEGRIILPGVDTVSARDVYTGRELWVREMPGIGHPFTNLELEERYWRGQSVYMTNLPGANFIGSFYASAPDGIYVRYRGEIICLDPETGETTRAFPVAQAPGSDDAYDDYGHISLWEDLLISSVEPQYFDDKPIGGENWNATSSNLLVVRNRHTGEVLWSREAEIGFRHNTIITGGGRLFVVDGLSDEAMLLLERRGEQPQTPPRLLALDLRSGEQIWDTNDDVFGTFLLYSGEHNLVLQSGRRGGKRVLSDEPNRPLKAHNADDGSIVWERSTGYAGPVALHGTWVVPGRPGPMVDLLTGDLVERVHPLTRETVSRAYHRTYGCGTLNTSEHLLMFRSGAAGFTDLASDAGTGNLSGFRAGCTNNLIAADGVLCAPDYTRTCTCSYQNQTSLAFIHMPDVEMWTHNQITRGSEPVQQAGVNLAAPGNHMSDTGVIWLEYPRVGGPAPEMPITMTPEDGNWFRVHASLVDVEDGALPWVAGSGFMDIETLELELTDADTRKAHPYTVRLHFIEPENIGPGERVFDVYLQGTRVLDGFDPAAEAGGRNRGLMKEFTGVSVRGALRIDLRPKNNRIHRPILCGVEVSIEADGVAVASAK